MLPSTIVLFRGVMYRRVDKSFSMRYAEVNIRGLWQGLTYACEFDRKWQ